MNDKKRFEFWTIGEGGNITPHADDLERYANATVQGRWLAWQAAMKVARTIEPMTQPTYYVVHPDGSHSKADPQPVAL